jgi:hypothetical protein
VSAQAPSTVILIRAERFIPNPATAADNAFQRDLPAGQSDDATSTNALAEMDAVAQALRDAGVTVHVFEDERHERWVNLADARKAAGITASDGALEKSMGARFQRRGRDVWLRDDALVEYLSRSTDAVALRFRTWVDRQVMFPGQKIRERLGVRPQDEEDD